MSPAGVYADVRWWPLADVAAVSRLCRFLTHSGCRVDRV